MRVPGVVASSIRKTVSDSFTRTTSGSLVSSTSGDTWEADRGIWFANGSQGQSNDTASTYPISSIELYNNVDVSASVSPGTGVVVWLSDANSWWASHPYYTQTTTSYTADCGYCAGCSAQCGGGPTGYQYSVPSCSCGSVQTSSDCSGGPTGYSTSQSSCSCGTQQTTTDCNGGPTATQTTIPSCSCGTVMYDADDCFGPPTGYIYSSQPNCDCGNAQSQTSYTYGFCRAIGQEPVCPSCPGGTTTYVLSGCGSGSWRCECAQTTWQCSLSIRQLYYCSASQRTLYRCSASPVSIYRCSDSLYTPSGGSYPNCNCGKPQCNFTTTTTNYFLRLINSVGGTVSTVTSDVSLSTAAAAVLVQTSGNTITAKAYSDTAMTNQIGTTISHTATSPNRGLSVGIVKAPSALQGSTVDNFSATQFK